MKHARPSTSANMPIRIGVIGCGNVLSAYRATIDKLRARRRVEVTMACGRESQRAVAGAEVSEAEFTTQAEDVISAAEVDLAKAIAA